MSEEKRNKMLEIVEKDTNDYLLERFAWYIQNFNPCDFDRCDCYEIVKAEILKRMNNR